ncbi:hypothetical protein AGMMS49975_11440 [Clostridia bacterium]|nr:hypothetical protein AGMMS49975_11440 [Clostridia bacterium]GHU75800.1 hypothetical protein FACS1894188_07310 [Clostridia bacterium]
MFIKLNRHTICHKKIQFDNKRYNVPFFSILNESSTIRAFLDALSKGATSEAAGYLSQTARKNLDINELCAMVGSRDYKRLSGRRFINTGYKTDAILLIDNESINKIIHLHLVKEPDSVSKWKIFDVESER